MRSDTMWRDPSLAPWHAARNIPFPAAGMTLPMVEYDRGAPVGLVNYIRRDEPLPTGGSSYRALAGLHKVTGAQLPFLTAVYDPYNWAFRLVGHNDAARELLETTGWKTCTEREFVSVLYAMRWRLIPALERYGVRLNDLPWYPDELAPVGPLEDLCPWPGADISQRRRSYEPVNPDGTYTRFSLRNPCTDIDLAVCCPAGRLRLVVDYKSAHARVPLGNTSHSALGSLYRAGGHQVPYMVARTVGDGHSVEVLGVNEAARRRTGTNEWRELEWPAWAAFLGAMAS